MANILVVDDEPKMTSLICGQLEDAGHQVATTTKPAEALDLIAKGSFDIVITDLSMPEISGMKVLEEALKKEGTEVLMMTAYGSAETAVEAMKKAPPTICSNRSRWTNWKCWLTNSPKSRSKPLSSTIFSK